MSINLEYLCKVIGNLSGVPIRLYKKNKLILFYSLVNLVKDPFCLYSEKLLKINDNISYFITPNFDYYGIVSSKDTKIVIGPSRQFLPNDQVFKEEAFKCNVSTIDMDEFIINMKNIIPMPLDSIIQILFTINHILNKEILSLQDIHIYDKEQLNLAKKIDEIRIKNLPTNLDISKNTNNSFALEETLMNMVRHGDSSSLKKWIENAPAVRSGIIAHEQLRQYKNTFIVTTTLTCRNAIRGGMDINEALSLSDAYIQSCELLSNINSIENLQYRMIVDYTERVERIRRGKAPSNLTIKVTNYVLNHLSEPIKTEDIAKSLFFSRSYLSTKFKNETGISLTDYILKEKANEGKRLLRYSDKSISSISEYLGFSSQSHFNRVFKKYIGISPKEYREIKTS